MTEQEREAGRDLVDLCTVENAVELQVLEGLLADRRIPCELMTWHSTPYDGIFEATRGHATVKVYAEDLERAKLVLADFKNHDGSAGTPD